MTPERETGVKMMLSVLRSKKIIRDLRTNRSRSLLAVFAMAIGLMGVGAVLCAYSILVRELAANYMRTNPASATIVMDSVDENLVEALEKFPGIGSVEARGLFQARVKVGEHEWKTLLLFVVDDFTAMRIGKFEPEAGEWPPRTGGILIERAAVRVARRNIGDSVVVLLPGEANRELHISGSVHDPAQAPAWMEGLVYGYITRGTLALFGKTALNEVLLTVADRSFDKNHIRNTVKSVTDWMEKQGHHIQRIDIPEPGHHPHQTQLKALLFLLQSFGGLSFALSMILAVSLIQAIMAQQVRQIGIMKAIGARTPQTAAMYIGGALFLGIIAVVLGLPAGVMIARGYARFAAQMLNFEILDPSIPWWTYTVLIVIGLLTPVLSALYPILKGSRISVREALADYGIPADQTTNRVFDRVLTESQRLPRPLLLSLRNTFRRRGRIALTLGTLGIGGAMFITALDIGASIRNTIRTFQNAMRYDLKITLSRPMPLSSIEPVVRNIPGVVKMEGWGQAEGSLVYEDGTDGNAFQIMAPSSGTDLLRLRVIKGRWLSPEDSNALVVNHIFMYREPHLHVGDEVVVRMGAQKTRWRIVGLIRQIGAPTAFAKPSTLAGLMDQNGLVKTLPIVTKDRSAESHSTVAKRLERAFSEAGMDIKELISIYDIQRILEDHFVVLTMLLLFMSILIVLVGGLGLMTTMSIHVIERKREIGIMRAIGASSHELLKIITVEGLVIGMLSWLLAAVLALPLSKYIGDLFGMIFLRTTLDFALSPVAFLLWMGVVVLFSMAASFFPARNATRLTVRDTLAYE